MSDLIGAAPYTEPPPPSLWERLCVAVQRVAAWPGRRRERMVEARRVEELWSIVRLAGRHPGAARNPRPPRDIIA